jgi:Na+-transporting methylmalonyl-CoA/oxaloacetate decarboxylase gamma subunit
MWKILGEGAKFSLVAQSMVFLVLFLLALVILLMKLIFYRPAKSAAGFSEGASREPQDSQDSKDSQEAIRVAAIAAALEMHRQSGTAEPPPITGPEGPWAPRSTPGKAATSQSRARRWSHG